MDALSAFLQLNGLAGGKTHPVSRPDFVLTYEQTDITADVANQLLSFDYTDYLDGQSDELQLAFEDVDGRWLNAWYPAQGDSLSLSVGDQFTGLIAWGSFEIAEIEHERRPDVVTIKALSTGISKANRTLQPKAYENTSLAQIVRIVAGRLKLSVTGTVRDIAIKRATQYQERDVEFLTRLAAEYGHAFKIVGQTLVFTDRLALAEQDPVAVVDWADVIRSRLRDLIKGVPESAVVSGYDSKTKQAYVVKRQSKAKRAKAKRSSTTDTLKITPNKGESQAQMEARADAALEAADDQIAGTLTLVGSPKLVAGQVLRLTGYGQMSGKYLVKQSRHSYSRLAGYTTDIEVKMLEYIADEELNNAGT